MGEFAEFCKGEQMGAFLPLLLATVQVLGHHSFQPRLDLHFVNQMRPANKSLPNVQVVEVKNLFHVELIRDCHKSHSSINDFQINRDVQAQIQALTVNIVADVVGQR